MTAWNDFNNAEDVNPFSLIPKGTLLKVRMTIKPGGHDDPAQGWTGGWATRNDDTGAIYLSAEFVVLEGEYAKRKLWSLIGLHSSKGATWAQMGRSFIKSVLNSAFNVQPSDNSASALARRCIRSFGDLDGLVFAAQIDWEKDSHGYDKAIIRVPIMPDHAQYAAVMGGMPGSAHGASSPPNHGAPAASRPSWA